MAAQTRIYGGFAPRGRQTLPTRTVAFEAGVPIEVDADEAAALDAHGDWETPTKANPAEPTDKTPKTQGSAPDTKEP